MTPRARAHRIRREPRSRARFPGLHVAVVLGTFAAFAFVVHSRLHAPADADSFYHVRHAWLYRRGGLFQTAFPWAQYSVIKTYAADLWYGFHVLLLPLTRFETYVAAAAASYRPDRFKAASLWLREHARPGEIVFNVHWGMFPHLFFWNTSSYYVSGMDPIFQYAYDPGLYWKNHFLAFAGATNFTCASTRCTGAESIPTYDVLTQDFRASYMLIEKLGQPKLYRYLESDARFMKVLETDEDALYRIR